MRRKPSGALLQLVDQFLQLGAARLGIGSFAGADREHEPLHRVGLASAVNSRSAPRACPPADRRSGV